MTKAFFFYSTVLFNFFSLSYIQSPLLNAVFVPARVPSFCIQTKFRLKNRVATVYILQCKINFFISSSLTGLSLIPLKCETMTQVFFFYSPVLFHFFCFPYIEPSKNFQISNQIFSCHVHRLSVVCTLVRPDNSLDGIWKLPKKA